MKKIKFLANVNVEKPLIDFLNKKGFDVKWVTSIDKRMPDDRVCEITNSEQRIIITNDKDFGEIVFYQKKIAYGIILMRVKGQNSSEKIILLDKLLENYLDKIVNHFVVLTKTKFRFIPLEVINLTLSH
jgi:predicted nuclease of predicted toxin-antitoxin system